MFRYALAFLFICSAVSAKDCDGSCGQGEGDCDWSSDCLEGLVCDFDWFWGEDFCVAGPDTKNFEWEDWGEWSECAGDCGSTGVRSRHRVCIPPVFGGYECPALVDSETEACVTLPCAIDSSNTEAAWCHDIDCGTKVAMKMCPTTCQVGVGNPKCNPNTWEGYNNECCSVEEPCGLGEGDCDIDDECYGHLVCGKNNCRRDGTGFTIFADCCQPPEEATRSISSREEADAAWCQDMNCSTKIGKRMCPNTCEEAEYVPNSDAEWCNDIDCTTFISKIVCNDTCKQRGF